MNYEERQKGGIAVFAAGLILTLSGFAVLAVDVGRIFIVRNEMQNVADAAALAGANCLTRTSTPSGAICASTLGNALNWDAAVAKARDQLGRNAAAGNFISTSDAGHTIDVGYWNLGCPGTSSCRPGPSGGTFSTTFSPITDYDKPAVRVSVRKAEGVNNGSIFMLTRAIFGGGSDVPMNASAVAVISSPSTVASGNLIPQAINQCLFDRYWDSANNTPRLVPPSTPPVQILDRQGRVAASIPQVAGQPWTFRIGSAYQYDGCQAGQWSSFAEVNSSASYVRGLIQNGNPTPLGIGENIFIQPGAEASLYRDLSNEYPNLPVVVTVMVVDHNLNTRGQTPLLGFAGFRITAIEGPPNFYIQGNFVSGGVTQGSSGVGPFFGTYTPPRIAN